MNEDGDFACPLCKKRSGVRVMAFALPMKFCLNMNCNCLWGEPFATIYTLVVSPIEGFFNEGFSFLPYKKGEYFKTLWHWLFHNHEEPT